MERKYLPDFSELCDRLSIDQLKEVHIPEHKEKYAQEIKDIMHDLDLLIQTSDLKITSETIRAIVVNTMANTMIWHGESAYRAHGGKDGVDLHKTHAINGLRCSAKNMITKSLGQGKIDVKIDCLASEFSNYQPSW